MNSAPRVLIVDELADSREVLTALFARRGATTIEARRPAQAAQLAESQPVDLIVFDADSDHTEGGTASAALQAAASRHRTPIVILGSVPPPYPLAGGQFISKPYHYGPLVRRIKGLLGAA